ncbi:glycosyltransferase family 2 protein [Tessaracoccus sp. MC1679]|uniref:glycosyltransferase family A protein n=1 Tax=Tessaracoccus sp. MC1679 TaxID=2760313 RepID=UPI001600C034|nr:glycosyltransferase family A protein [Tessaracoccus sp. MC1679]MBB1517117.1 glycosyltransferase family 2 protein [Tessaracoccus sp. MC1679]
MGSLVSIVIPTFNDDPEHLDQAIRSALSQTYSNIEVLVIDDGSPTPVQPRDNVRLLRQQNGGVSAARNAAIAAAHGDFIQLLDGDDWLDPQAVEEGMGILADPRVLVAYPKLELFGTRGGAVPLRGETTLDHLMVNTSFPGTAMFRTAAWRDVGGYDESLRLGYEDWEFWVRLLRDGGIAREMPTARLHYRMRDGSRSAQDPVAARSATLEAILRNNPEHLGQFLRASWRMIGQQEAMLAAKTAQLAVWERRTAPFRWLRQRARGLARSRGWLRGK